MSKETKYVENVDLLINALKACQKYSYALYEHWDHSIHDRDCMVTRDDIYECTCRADHVQNCFHRMDEAIKLAEVKS